MFSFYKKKKTTKRKADKGNTIARLDKVFALYIRLRDVMPNGMGKCISCGKIKPYRELDCGHFFGRMNMATRFDEDNCSAECQGCNRVKADHLIYYQENLIKKIGVARFSTLRERAHSSKKWSEAELEELIMQYTQEVKRLSKEKGICVKI
jgi:5-methylcytosine-specific restriction endonuclease McrA